MGEYSLVTGFSNWSLSVSKMLPPLPTTFSLNMRPEAAPNSFPRRGCLLLTCPVLGDGDLVFSACLAVVLAQ